MQATHHKKQIRNWIEMVSSQLDTLSKPEATVLALWSFAAVILQTASLSLVSLFLAGLLEAQPNTVRQRLREFYKPRTKKKGKKRRELNVSACFTPLFRWVLRLWPEQQIAIALDPTLCRNRFAALVVSLVYPGGSIPLAWKILPANEEAAWMPHWKPLLKQLQQALPESYRVLVLCDRGLYKKELFLEICSLGFHPVMRLTKNGTFNPASSEKWIALSDVLPQPGSYYRGRGIMFKTSHCQLHCTFVALWDTGYDEPWYLITNLAPQHLDGACYGLRTWIEQGFRCIKSTGCKWEQSRMVDCDRIERFWLVYALSLLWTQALAGEIEAGCGDWASLPMINLFKAKRKHRRYRIGFIILLLTLIKGKTLPLPKALYPDAWPVRSPCKEVQLC